MKKCKSSFVSPVKSNTTTTTGSSISATPTKKSSKSFQTPTKNVNTTTTTTTTTPIKNTPSKKPNSLFQTPSKPTINEDEDDEGSSGSGSNGNKVVDLFKSIPNYIQQFLKNEKNDNQLSLIIHYSYDNWDNNPFTYHSILDLVKKSQSESSSSSSTSTTNINLDYIKTIIKQLVEKNIIKEIIVNDKLSVFSSIPWFKIISFSYLQIEINKFEKEAEKEKQQSTTTPTTPNNKTDKYNKKAPKNTIASITATLSPSKSKCSGNHLSGGSSTPTKKRNQSIAFNLDKEIESSPNKFIKDSNSGSGSTNTSNNNHILSSKYELQIERELQSLADEKKRLLKSIQEKKQLIEKFQSKSSPVSEQKKTIPTNLEEKRVEGLILKWKKACQDSTILLQEKLAELLVQSAGNNSGSVSCNDYGYDNGEVKTRYSSEECEDVSELDFQLYQERVQLQNEPIEATKHYILKQFGVDPKTLNLDIDADEFVKETTTTSKSTIKK